MSGRGDREGGVEAALQHRAKIAEVDAVQSPASAATSVRGLARAELRAMRARRARCSTARGRRGPRRTHCRAARAPWCRRRCASRARAAGRRARRRAGRARVGVDGPALRSAAPAYGSAANSTPPGCAWRSSPEGGRARAAASAPALERGSPGGAGVGREGGARAPAAAGVTGAAVARAHAVHRPVGRDRRWRPGSVGGPGRGCARARRRARRRAAAPWRRLQRLGRGARGGGDLGRGRRGAAGPPGDSQPSATVATTSCPLSSTRLTARDARGDSAVDEGVRAVRRRCQVRLHHVLEVARARAADGHRRHASRRPARPQAAHRAVGASARWRPSRRPARPGSPR